MISDTEFRVMLDLFMVSDPWPLDWGHEHMETVLDSEAILRGYDHWVEAYHEMPYPLREEDT